MSWLLVVSFAGLAFFLISQFGGKLTARNSLIWWFIFAFLGVCVIRPSSLEPIAHFLGIQLVSNFVLATMILFLAFQAIQESAFTTKHSRKLRDLISSLAAENFVKCMDQPRSESGKVTVLIGMPCYNEAGYLPKLEKEIRTFLASPISEYEDYIFCVVNDGSEDETRSLLEANLRNASTHHPSNLGVAGVMLTAFKSASLIDADFVVQCDSDGQHPLQSIPLLVAEAKRLNADLLIGSRYLQKNTGRESTTTPRWLGSRLIVICLKILFGPNEVTDPTSGFRVYSKNAQKLLLKSMPDEYPEPETIALLLREKLLIKETAVSMLPRQAGVSSLDGLSGFRFMLKVFSALVGLRLRSWVP